jgi:hypothetical protein
MKKLKFIPLVMFSVMLLASCQSKESKIEKLVTSHLEQSLENPENLKVLEIAEPDSAFGLNYFTKQEQAYMLSTVTNVTKVLMERTEYMTKPDLDDAYTMTLADLEMRMSTGLFSGMLGDCKKGAWSGWKVRVTYICKSKYGCMYKAQRWYFLDKDCQTVIRSFDLPIVETSKADKTTKSATKKKQGNTASKIMLSTGK